MSRENIFTIGLKYSWCKKKKLQEKPINLTPLPRQPLKMKGKILKIPVVNLVLQSVNMCLSCLKSKLLFFFLFFFWSCPQSYCRAGRFQKSQAYIATDFLSTIWHHNMTVSFMSSFIFILIRKPADIYKHV